MPELSPYPRFSDQEFGRRYRLPRDGVAAADLAALVVYGGGDLARITPNGGGSLHRYPWRLVHSRGRA